jgi:hypothetical protein
MDADHLGVGLVTVPYPRPVSWRRLTFNREVSPLYYFALCNRFR